MRVDFKQLPLDGNTNDQARTNELLVGYKELHIAVAKFYRDNAEYNPRQLHYLVSMESLDEHLDAIIDWGSSEHQVKQNKIQGADNAKNT